MTQANAVLVCGAVAIVLILLATGRAKKPPQEVESLPRSESRMEKSSITHSSTGVKSYEIPVPDDFVYRHRSRNRLSPAGKRLRQQSKAERAALAAAEKKESERREQLRIASEKRKLRDQLRRRSPVGLTTDWLRSRLHRQQSECFWCGVGLHPNDFQLDHVWPLSLGGAHDIANLVVSCQECNLSKGSRSPWEFADNTVSSARWQSVRDELELLGVGHSATSSRQTPIDTADEQGEQLTFEWAAENQVAVRASLDGNQLTLRFDFE
jgi:5-methylcytosine-specific restriction endonuclease McrA